MLETARDTLFLTHLPAQQLPWVYLAIAVLAVAAARLNYRALERFSRRATLALTLFVSGTITALFWLWSDGSIASIYAFY
ncbi:MAG TPA: hypothetical protein VKB80_08030, partial [Kofleriaceae bacterium]|nr:hypothetical protein [Kofleriaceae bacterium]